MRIKLNPLANDKAKMLDCMRMGGVAKMRVFGMNIQTGALHVCGARFESSMAFSFWPKIYSII